MAKSKAQETFDRLGITEESFKGALDSEIRQENPFAQTGLNEQYQHEAKEFDQGFLADLATGLGNSLFLDTAEGIANLIPTMGLATQSVAESSKLLKDAGKKDYLGEFLGSWQNNVADFFEDQRMRYSDDANKPMEEFSDINPSMVAKGVGEGLGFIMSIIAGGSGGAKIATNLAGKAASLTGQRLGSFITGTTLMYPNILDEAKKAGLNDNDASQFALGVSGIVSLTEGAALEWIGKIATKPITSTVASAASKKTLKDASNLSNLGLQKVFTKNYTKNVGSTLSKGLEGAAVEFGQEFGQTYIEEGSKQLFDIVNKGQDKGNFGSDITSYETFVEATFGGLIGALLGGGMTSIGSVASRGAKGESLAEESLFGYINNSIRQNKPENIEKITATVNDMFQKGEISEEQATNINNTVQDLSNFSNEYKISNIEDGVSLYQLYQLDKIKKDNVKLKEDKLAIPEDANEALQGRVKAKQGQIDMIDQRVQEQFNEIFESGKPNTKNKTKFEETLSKYNAVKADVMGSVLEDDVVQNKLDKIFKPKAKKEKTKETTGQETQKEKSSDYGKSFKDGEITITEKALDDKARVDKIDEAFLIKDEAEKKQAIQEIADEYGITPEAVEYLYDNEEVSKEDLVEVTEKTVAEIKEEGVKGKEVGEAMANKLTKGLAKEDAKESDPISDLFDKPSTTEEVKQPELELDELDFDDTGSPDPTYKEIKTESTKEQEGVTLESELSRVDKEEANEIAYEEKMAKESQVKIPEENTKSVIAQIKKEKEIEREYLREKYKKAESQKEQTQPTQTEMEFEEGAQEDVQEEIEIPAEVKSMTPKQIQEQLDSEEITDDDVKVLTREQAIRAEKTIKEKEDKAFMDAMRMKPVGKDQRVRDTSIQENNSRIEDNIPLYEKIKKHFKKIFPNIPLTEIDRLAEKFGPHTLARLTERGVLIDPKNALQTSAIHEYAHVYLEVLGNKNPLVKAGLKFIEDTQFFKDAQELYPDYTKEEQLEEALAEALAINSLEKLQLKFEGSKLAKFQEFAKRFWRKIKSFFTKPKSGDIIELISDGLTISQKPFSVGVNGLVGINKDQRKKSNNPRFSKTVDIVSIALMGHRLKNIQNKAYIFNTKSKSDLATMAFGELLNRYWEEQSTDKPTKVFSGVDLQVPSQEETLTDADTYRRVINEFGNKVKNQFPEIYQRVNNVMQSMVKTNIELDNKEDVTDADVENNQLDAMENDTNKTPIKATKKVNTSVRSIFSTIVDEDGHKIETDKIFEYVGRVSRNTHNVATFKEQVEKDAKYNIIAQRVQDVIDYLGNLENEDGKKITGQLNGFLKTVTSLEQIKSEGSNLTPQYDKKTGELIGYVVTNALKNKSEPKGLRNIKEWKSSEKNKRDFLNIDEITDDGSMLLKAIKTWDKLSKDTKNKLSPFYKTYIDNLVDQLNKLFDGNITYDDFQDVVNQFKPTQTYTSAEEVYNHLFGKYDSLKNFWNGEQEFKKISGYMSNLELGINKNPMLANTYLNGANNTVTTTQMGHWVSQLNSIFRNTERIKDLLDNKLFKGNKVLEYFKKNGIDYMVPDSLKNINTKENFEHSEQSYIDHHIEQFHKFASIKTNDYYNQSVGVLSNRDNKLYFRVPNYKTEKDLNDAMEIQMKSLQAQVDSHTKNMTTEDKAKVVTDFNNMYIYKARLVGNDIKIEKGVLNTSNIKEIKDIIVNNDLGKYYQAKIGSDKQFQTLDQLVKHYYLTEAVNRTFLSDIYAGPAIFHSNPNSRKGGVESAIKRMSALNSTGENIELSKPVTFVVYKNGKNEDMTSDSQSMYSPGMSEDIKEFSGTFDPMGINSKNNLYQIDPVTGKSIYVKTATLNVENKYDEDGNFIGTNLDGFGEGYKVAANTLSKLEKQLGTHVVLLDEDAFKGTFNENNGDYVTMDIADIVSDVAKGNIDKIKNNATKPITVENLRSPFNLNKSLETVDKQSTIFSTQAANIQYAALENDMIKSVISAFENDAVNYLRGKMAYDKEGNSKVVLDLKDFNNVVDMMIDDLNERESSATSELLEAIRDYNQKASENPNIEPITSFDHSSVRPIYEQFVSSRLSKKGIRIEMAGNFMHQLADMHIKGEEKLDYTEVAVSWKMFGNTKQEAQDLFDSAQAKGEPLKVAVVRIPASAPVSMFAGTVKYFLDTDANVVKLSDKFVDVSDSDHDGDKAMVYRQDMKADGTVDNDSFKTKMFNSFYNNLSNPEFKKEGIQGSLDFEKELDYIEDKEEYKSGDVNENANVTSKLNLGSIATGRYAVAGKLMAVMAQINAKLNKSIDFNGRELKSFTSESLDDVAIFLQAALDMGNNPLLASTGFNRTTIDIGNAMLLLGLNKQEVTTFLKSKPIQELSKRFEDSQVAFGKDKNISINKFMSDLYAKDDKGVINWAKTKENYKNQKEIIQFLEFYEVAEGLSRLIPFIQLDKKIPNTSQEVSSLLDNINKFHSESKGKPLPFNVDPLLEERQLYTHRKGILADAVGIYRQHLLTSSPIIKDALKAVVNSMSFINSLELSRRINEQLIQYVSQQQLNNKAKTGKQAVYDFSAKMKSVHDAVKFDSTKINMEEEALGVVESIMSGANTIEGQIENGYRKDEIDSWLNEYKSKQDLIANAEMLKGNKLFDYLDFTELNDGKVLVKLDSRFKATEETKTNLKKDIVKIKSLWPDLYRQLEDYQLLRYGVNNKIGSFIEALPDSIDLKMSLDATNFKDNTSSVLNESGRQFDLMDSIAEKNIDLINEADPLKIASEDANSFILEDKSSYYLKKQNDMEDGFDLYKRDGGKSSMEYKKANTVFEGDNNYSKFITQKMKNATKEDIDNIINGC